MIREIEGHKIELVVITVANRVGEVEGEIAPERALENRPSKTVIFNDHPPVSVGDKILARVITNKDPKTGTALLIGKLVRKINSAPEKIIGIFKKTNTGTILIPTEKRNKKQFKVYENNIRALDGSLVEAQINKTRRKSAEQSVNLIRNLGNPTTTNLASMIAINEYGIPDKFSDQVLQKAQQRANISIENPNDLTNIPFISIDPNDARDHDDAICAMKDLDNPGGYIIWVAIADVAKYILQGSELDLEALRRGNSTYFPDLVVPMIPDILSGDLCSLKEGKPRAALVVKIWLNKLGQKTSHNFFRCIIKNELTISYEEAQTIIDNSNDSNKKSKLKNLIRPLHAAYKLLEQQTKHRAPLELELIEQEILFDSVGEIRTLRSKERFESHKIVEEFMIIANVCAAETIHKNKLPFLYRVHEPPTFEKLISLKTIAKSLNVNLNTGARIRSKDLNHLLQKAKQENCSELISMTILRAMSQAHYSPENQGHFGLSLPSYTHFTSPIRRYSDILIHRALIHIHNWDEGLKLKDHSELLKVGEQLSKTERRSMLAERATRDRYLASFLKDRLGSEFAARISGLSKSGIFVRLMETGADGLIPISCLNGEKFNLNNEKNKLIGRSSRISFNIGASVLVKLTKANPISGSLLFNLIQYENKPLTLPKKLGRRSKKKLRGRRI
ncbi:MAG: VacB/RNase II family 3'-5' exoribonuclease [Paracoccaceae bacterium]|nr:VacB/RNase II family 3'-5' exoribonuclease [Paracoccaceae bacterium]